MKINIEINSLGFKYVVFANNLTCEFWSNGKHYQVNAPNFLYDAINLVRSWESVVESKSAIDGVKYKIAYDDDEDERVLVGTNVLSKDVYKLLDLIYNLHPEVIRQKVIKSELKAIKRVLRNPGGGEDGK